MFLFLSHENGAIGCNLEIGSFLSIAAAGAFYLASVLYCCIPRTDPCLRSSKKKTGTADDDVEQPKVMEQQEVSQDVTSPTVEESPASFDKQGNVDAAAKDEVPVDENVDKPEVFVTEEETTTEEQKNNGMLCCVE